ncbi:hypothetical protein [Legionella feeleii]|uniref:Uncharacterized protein n=1 Tax=Legionella feeleii TaxID=453 RepID=A0A0W0TGZ1_9GAMM|nr:hypothetical protein [Legionella feeleii]KTC94855.1 hypothetical protein Lfee_2519 [Legionella feeleii]SPX62061.1 Uncharacterised protein [Legionella feeleii]
MKALAALKHRILFPKRKTMAFVLLGLTMSAGAFMGLVAREADAAGTYEEASTTLVMARLNALQTQITSLQESVAKPFSEVDLGAIARQINALALRVDALKPADSEALTHQLSQSLTKTESTLGSQLSSIQEAVSQLRPAKTPRYLKPASLPFKVVSVDSIQQTPVASVAYDFKTIPLEKGDQLAGWRFLSIDYGRQRVELENSRKERVLLTQAEIG